MSNLNSKLKDILLEAKKYSGHYDHDTRVVRETAVKIKQAFVDAGWVKLPTAAETVQHRKEWGDEFTYVLKGGVYTPQGNKIAKLMTGQEWYDRFDKELNKVEGGYHKWVGPLPGEVLIAAKKAAGIEQ